MSTTAFPPSGGLWAAEPVAAEGDVETKQASVLWTKLSGLELDDEVLKLFNVEEEQIDVIPTALWQHTVIAGWSIELSPRDSEAPNVSYPMGCEALQL